MPEPVPPAPEVDWLVDPAAAPAGVALRLWLEAWPEEAGAPLADEDEPPQAGDDDPDELTCCGWAE